MLRSGLSSSAARLPRRCYQPRRKAWTFACHSLSTKFQEAMADIPAPYCCGGSVVLPEQHRITLCLAPNESSKSVLPVSVPIQAYQQLEDLKAASKEAVFGKGNKDVLDPSYRSALALEPDKFVTNFDLAENGILDTIKTILMPDAASITAQLYKLNIYRPGDFFRPHVDTPRGENMFGSLVVCLPQAFTGGQLHVSHRDGDTEFAWSKAAGSNIVQWAAFYSDCKHEILPVNTGHRITLTYNLYATPLNQSRPSLPGLSCQSTQLYQALVEAIADPSFMPSGGRIGMPCVHRYPHTHDTLFEAVPSMLKGQDAVFFAISEQLGLSASVKAVWSSRGSIGSVPLWAFREDFGVVCTTDLAPFQEDMCFPGSDVTYFDSQDDFNEWHKAQDDFIKEHVATDVLWIGDDDRNPSFHEQAAYLYFGNQSSASVSYTAAAILAAIPAWDSYQRKKLVDILKK